MIYQQSLRPMRPLGSLSNPQTFGGKDFSPSASEAGPLTEVFGKNNPGIVVTAVITAPSTGCLQCLLRPLGLKKHYLYLQY